MNEVKNLILKIAMVIILAFIIIPINDVKAASNGVMLSNNSNSFYRELGQAIENKTPIFNRDTCTEKQINRFNELYKVHDKANISKLKGASIISLDSVALKLKAIQISIEKNYDIYFYPEVPDKNKYENIISFGDINISETENIGSENIDNYYDDMFKDSNLYVYVESEEYTDESLYMAAFRKGKIIFNLDEIKDDNEKYLAWFITPDKFNKDDYVTMYKRFRNLSGIGLLSENTKGNIMTLLNKSFYYDDLNLDKIMYSYSDFDSENIIKEDGQWKYIKKQDNLDNDILSKANFINIFAHGSYNGFEIAKKPFDEFTLMKAPIIVAESCETLSTLNNENIGLNAIENGAIAYVGSIKVGGVAGICGSSDGYLGSYKNVPLSKVAKINNEFMLKDVDTIPRAVVIGDPMFYFNRNEDFVKIDDNKVSLNSPYDLGLSKLIYLDLKDNFKSVKSSSNNIKLDSNLKNYKNTNIVGVIGKDGTLEFSPNHDILAESKEIISMLEQYTKVCVDQILILGIFITIFLLILSPSFFKVIQIDNPKTLFPILMSIAIVFLEKIFLETSFISIGRIILYSGAFIVVQNVRSKRKYLNLIIALIISLLIVFISISKTVNSVAIGKFTVSMIVYYSMLVVIYKVIRKALDFILSKFNLNIGRKRTINIDE